MSLRIQRRGFTLIELLLSLVIAVLIIALVFSMYRTTSGAVQRQAARAKGGPAAAKALEQLRDDLMHAFLPAEDSSCAFTVTSSNLSFCAILPAEGESDPRWGRTFHVDYFLEEGALTRVVYPASGPGSVDGATTNVLIGDVDRFAVSVYDGTSWQDTWTGDNAQGHPHAARIEIASAKFTGKTNWQTEVFIPAGNVVTSSLQRTTSEPPPAAPAP